MGDKLSFFYQAFAQGLFYDTSGYIGTQIFFNNTNKLVIS